MDSKRINTLKQFTNLVGKGVLNALVVTGEGGMGKSYNVLSSLREQGLKENEDYCYINSFTTSLALYNYVYENKDKKVIVIDDAESFMSEKRGLSILKALLWSATGTRKVNYLTTSKEASVPEFELKANFIILMNKLPEDMHFKALATRAVVYELKLNFQEIMQIIESLSQNLTILPETLEFIKKHSDESTQLNIRTAVQIDKIMKSDHPDKEGLSMELLKSDEDKKAVVELLKKYNNNKALAVQEFMATQRKSRASFYRLVKSWGL